MTSCSLVTEELTHRAIRRHEEEAIAMSRDSKYAESWRANDKQHESELYLTM